MSIVIATALLLIGSQDPVTMHSRHPALPDYRSMDFKVRCGRRELSLNGMSAAGAQFSEPTAFLGRSPLRLPADLKTFLSAERAVYSIAATCPDTPTFALMIYRAERTRSGAFIYSQRAVSVDSVGQVVDRGTEPSDAETFWTR